MKNTAYDDDHIASGCDARHSDRFLVSDHPAMPSSTSKFCALEKTCVAQLHRLKLSQFRSYQDLDIKISAGPIVLTGLNGAGKTNLLEAISMLAPGRGLRRANRDEFGYRPEGRDIKSPWSVYADVIGPAGPASIGTGQSLRQDETRRQVKINTAPSAQSDLAQYITLSWLTPQMDGLFLGAPSQRRRFIDRLAIAFDPAHNGRLIRYEKAWRERQRLLGEGRGDEIWYVSLEHILAETGMAITATRSAMIADINKISSQLKFSFPQVKAKLTGQIADWLETGLPAIDIEDRLRSRARQNRQAGDFTMPGAHEVDLALDYNGHSASLASTGEQKALMISMILAHAVLQGKRLQRPPILLLDDVATHLDQARRNALFAICDTLGGQIWYSGADEQVFINMPTPPQRISIVNGCLEGDVDSQ